MSDHPKKKKNLQSERFKCHIITSITSSYCFLFVFSQIVVDIILKFTYACIYHNLCWSLGLAASRSIQLTVHDNKLPVLGENITLVCSSHGQDSSNVSLEWFKNKQDELIANCRGTNCTLQTTPSEFYVTSDGISRGTLTIRNLQSSDSTLYRCKSSTIGVESNGLNVTILRPSEYDNFDNIHFLCVFHSKSIIHSKQMLQHY